MTALPPPGWHNDPFGRFQHRYWDGARWTEHVATHGQPSLDPPVAAGPPTVSAGPVTGPSVAEVSATPGQSGGDLAPSRAAQRIQKQLKKAGTSRAEGVGIDSRLFDEDVLVINQKGKLLELRAEYAIFDQDGSQLAAVRGKRVSSRLQVVDPQGSMLLDLRREASGVSSKIIVADGRGAKIGRIVPSMSLNQRDREFKLEGPDKRLLGGVFREDRRRNREFNVQDAGGAVVADISKTHAGLAKELLSKADNYVVSLSGPVSFPLRALAVASTIVIDTKFHQA